MCLFSGKSGTGCVEDGLEEKDKVPWTNLEDFVKMC